MCGIFGIISPKPEEKLVDLMYFGLLEIQHRGQDGTGIGYADGERVRVEKGLGLVSSVFSERLIEKIKKDKPLALIGHLRYPTSGEASQINVQPHFLDTLSGRVCLCSNGDVPYLEKQKQELKEKGIEFYTENDAEFLLKKILYLSQGNVIEGIKAMMKTTTATYSAVLLTRNKVCLFRDPWGNRPLVWGQKENLILFASENCALNKIGVRPEEQREVEPGEIVIIDFYGNVQRIQVVNLPNKAHCIFELIYFSRPDSIVFGREVGSFRYLLGKYLAKEHPAQVDFVASVPDSGNFAGIGYAVASALPFRILLVRNPYIQRTFIAPGSLRTSWARQKYSVMSTLLRKWSKLVLVDDSIVRGTTNGELVKMIREAGAKKIHLRISCPPIIGPCYFGIATPTEEELIANRITKEGRPDIKGIARFLGVDSLGYLSLEGLKEIILKIGQDSKNFCLACFDKNYKIGKGLSDCP